MSILGANLMLAKTIEKYLKLFQEADKRAIISLSKALNS